MTAQEIMLHLYPGMPLRQRLANARWLDQQSKYVKDGGIIASPRDNWVVKKISDGDYEIESAPGRGH